MCFFRLDRLRVIRVVLTAIYANHNCSRFMLTASKPETWILKNFQSVTQTTFLSMKISRNRVNGYFGRLSKERKAKIGSIIGPTTATYLQRKTMTLMQFQSKLIWI